MWAVVEKVHKYPLRFTVSFIKTHPISYFCFYFQLSSTAKVARWFQQLNSNPQSLSRPESGFVSGDSRSERNQEDQTDANNENKDTAEDICDEYLLVEGTNNLWSKLSAKKRRKLLGLKLGKITTFWGYFNVGKE